jgi:hypothetical protein
VIYSLVMRFLGLFPVLLFLAAGFATTFFPRVMPRLTNAYYQRSGRGPESLKKTMTVYPRVSQAPFCWLLV